MQSFNYQGPTIDRKGASRTKGLHISGTCVADFARSDRSDLGQKVTTKTKATIFETEVRLNFLLSCEIRQMSTRDEKE